MQGMASASLLITCLCVCFAPQMASPIDDNPIRYFHSLDARHCQSPKIVSVLIHPDGLGLKLEFIESSRDFLPPNFQVDLSSRQLAARPCYYQGAVEGTDGLAAAKLANGMFSATFSYNGTMYDVLPQSDSLPKLTATVMPPAPSGKCGTANGHPHKFHLHLNSPTDVVSHKRRRRSAIDTSSAVSPRDRKYILLILVGDAAFYRGLNSSVTEATARLLEIGNNVNGMYKQIGVNVITVKTEVWTTDPFPMSNSSSGVNGSDLMRSFLIGYRSNMLMNITHSAAHLVTGYRMANGLSGIAPLGKLCQFPISGGVNLDLKMNGSAYGVSTTVAHELGHNLGMNHDDIGNTTCYCPDPQGCIMQTSVGVADPVRFSTCSVNSYVKYSVPNGIGYCISRPPDSSVIAAAAATCGNRIVEAGEDCDCGLPSYCNNSCCNPRTCKFTPGASCASGQCCNTASCSLLVRGTECRASRGVCDLPEFCSGSSEWCPEFDDRLLDGTACARNPEKPIEVLAHCYQGDCNTRDARCSALIKGSRNAHGIDNATMGVLSGFGYCGYTRGDSSYIFIPCTAENQRCGTLYCQLPSTDPPKSNWASVDDDQVKMLPESMAKSVAFTLIDLSPTGNRDPGMVPNGVECGTGRMCVDSQCVPLSSVASSGSALPNCNGRGRWTQSRLCYCDAGFAPPDCVGFGAGGSVSNKPTPFDPPGVSQPDNLAHLGIGIGIGLAVAGVIAVIAGVSVWVLRRSSSSGNLTIASPSPVTMMTPGDKAGDPGHSFEQSQPSIVHGFANPMSQEPAGMYNKCLE